MLNRLSEQKMHIVKWVLAVGWSILILSLFYDPITPLLTEPSNLSSPFHIDLSKSCVRVRDICLPNSPYSMTARIFWAMIVPAGLVIIFVFGHETWRRICPLSFFSQIPRALGMQRQQKIVSPSGKTRYQLFSIDKDSWLGRNHLYLQFAFFFTGLNIRILFVNSDRLALAAFLIFTILSAILVGYLFAGKSWCQYFCPMAPVQMVYTGTRGLLDSQAHLGKKLEITQSMCREVDKTTGKEKSACVACQNPCIDIDSERSYWEQIEKPDRKLLYFGYIGLVIGFYSFYYLYAGNWEYYFSGAWTHEEGQIANLFSPGFYIFGQEIPIPKLVTAPLTLAAFCAGAYAIGSIAENAYRRYLKNSGNNLPNNQILHRTYTLCTVIAWNIFWMFGSRPNLAVLPQWVERLFTGFIILVSGLWFAQTYWRTSEQYDREGLAVTLRRQLAKLGFDMAKILKRDVDELKADEVYVLAKILPEINREQKDRVYRGVLVEALEDGVITTSENKLLNELRDELGIDIDQHYSILASLGIADPTLFDSDNIITLEKRLRLDSYQKNLEFLIFDLVEDGIPVNKALKQKEERVIALKLEYAITEAEDELIVSNILGEEGGLVKNAQLLLSRLELLKDTQICLKSLSPYPCNSVCQLLRQIFKERQRAVIRNLLAILEILVTSPKALQIAEAINDVAYELVTELLDKHNNQDAWLERLDRSIVDILTIEPANSTWKVENKRNLSKFETSPFISLLKRLIHEDVEPLVKALCLQAIRSLDSNTTLLIARELNQKGIDSGSILAELVEAILIQSHPIDDVMTLIVEVEMDKSFESLNSQKYSIFQQSPLLIGSDNSNDIIIRSDSVASNHASIHFDQNEVVLRNLDEQMPIYLENSVITSSEYILKPTDKLSFSPSDSTSIYISWQYLPEQNLENLTTLDKMLFLFESKFFHQIEIKSLIELARYSQMHTYFDGDIICEIGDPSDRLFIILDGWINVLIKKENGSEQVVNRCFRGETIGELGVLTHSTRSAKLVVASAKSHTLSIADRDIDYLLSRSPMLAQSLLTVVSSRLRKEIHKDMVILQK